MTKYTSVSTTIDAVQFTGENIEEVQAFVGPCCELEKHKDSPGFLPNDRLAPPNRSTGCTAAVFDKLHSTWVGVKDGQWIIRGTKGEYYPCDAEVFEAKYREGEAEAPEPDYVWRLSKYIDSGTASLELSPKFEDAPDEAVNALIHTIGESLIKAGTMLMRSELTNDNDDDGADTWDGA